MAAKMNTTLSNTGITNLGMGVAPFGGTTTNGQIYNSPNTFAVPNMDLSNQGFGGWDNNSKGEISHISDALSTLTNKYTFLNNDDINLYHNNNREEVALAIMKLENIAFKVVKLTLKRDSDINMKEIIGDSSFVTYKQEADILNGIVNRKINKGLLPNTIYYFAAKDRKVLVSLLKEYDQIFNYFNAGDVVNFEIGVNLLLTMDA